MSNLEKLRLQCEFHLIAGDREAALTDYDLMLRQNPSAAAYVAKAKLLEMLEKYPEAVEHFEKALGLSNSSPAQKLDTLRLILDLDSSDTGILKSLAKKAVTSPSGLTRQSESQITTTQKPPENSASPTAHDIMLSKAGNPINADLPQSSGDTISAGIPASTEVTVDFSADNHTLPGSVTAILAGKQSGGRLPLASHISDTEELQSPPAYASSQKLPAAPVSKNRTLQDRPLGGELNLPDNHFGRYQILKKLGQGGMGAVYQALDSNLDRVVALKVIVGDKELDAMFAKRFWQEVRATAKIKHPHIVAIYDFGDNPKYYFTMEYVDGKTLKEVIQEGIVKSRRTAEILKEVSGAIVVAHQAGIIHRDLKPSNIMITQDGHVKVMDFGLAKFMSAESGLSTTGEIIGTPAYMSPEQALGTAVDVRSDVYAIGAIGYEMVTGRQMFHAESVVQVLYQVAHIEPIPPRNIHMDIDSELETIILKCLDKAPEKRYQTAKELQEDLDRYLAYQPILAKPPTLTKKATKWVKRNTGIAVALATVAVSLLIGVSYITYAWYQQRLHNKAMIILQNLTRWNKEEVPYAEMETHFEKARRLSSSFILYQMWGNACFQYARVFPEQQHNYYQLAREKFMRAVALNAEDYVSQYFLYLLSRLVGNKDQADSDLSALWKSLERLSLEDENEFKYMLPGIQSHFAARDKQGEERAAYQRRAMENYTKVLRYNPYMFCIFNFRGSLWLENKNYANAEKDLNKSLALNPRHKDAYFNRGLLHAMRGSEYLSEQEFAKAEQDLQKAETDFTKALSITPDPNPGINSDIYYQLACLYAVRKDTVQIYPHLEKALQQGISWETVAKETRLAYVRPSRQFQELRQKYGNTP